MIILFAVAIFALEASAFWRLPCRQALTIERIDPLTNFGGEAEHVHAIHGGNRELQKLRSLCVLWGCVNVWMDRIRQVQF
jgi:hypothetical protein